MVVMRFVAAVSVGACLVGCYVSSRTLVNDEGKALRCKSVGMGLVAGPMAWKRQDRCLEEAKERGYLESAGVTGIQVSDDAPMVAAVVADSPASKVDIRAGDAIIDVGGRRVASSAQARAELFGTPGTAVEVTVRRASDEPHVVTIERAKF